MTTSHIEKRREVRCWSQHTLSFRLCKQGLQDHVLFLDILYIIQNLTVPFNGLRLFIV